MAKPQPKRDRTVLVAIIGAVATVAAAAAATLISHVTWLTPASSTTPRSSSSAHASSQPAAPKLNFVPKSAGTVHWCNNFYIKADGQLPAGYKILIFDASSDRQFSITSDYTYDRLAAPAKEAPDEWVTANVWVGEEYKVDDNGKPVIRNGKHVSNAGFTAVVFAVLVPNSVAQLLEDASPHDVHLAQLPREMVKEAQFHATRSGDVKQCPDAANQN